MHDKAIFFNQKCAKNNKFDFQNILIEFAFKKLEEQLSKIWLHFGSNKKLFHCLIQLKFLRLKNAFEASNMSSTPSAPRSLSAPLYISDLSK